MDKKAVIRELATRNLEKRHKQEADNYIDFVKYWFKEGKKFDFEADEFHYLIAKYLEKCYRGEITRLIINIPPRHGKTEMITKCFPAWVLGKAPDTKIIVTGYSSTLTQQFSLEAKDIVASSVYKNVFPRHGGIREEQNTKEYWVLNGGGSYYATGTGGSITGKGASCVTGDTIIATREGNKRIDSIDLTDKIDILSYNHTTNTQEYKPMVAYMKTKNQKVYDIQTTGGNRIRATAGHKFFILGRGYTKTEDIRCGDGIVMQKQTMREVLKEQVRKMTFLPGMLFGNEENKFSIGVSNMQENCYKNYVGYKEMKEKMKRVFLLFVQMPLSPFFYKIQETLFTMLKVQGYGLTQQVLFDGMQEGSQTSKQETKGYSMSAMWNNSNTIEPYNQVLLNEVQEGLSLENNEMRTELELSSLNGIGGIPERVLSETLNYFRAGLRGVCSLFIKNKTLHTPQRQESKKQREGKSSDNLFSLSYNSSRLKSDTISSITSVEGNKTVYDIEVQDNHNFFANGILTHNCFIIDDPIKPDEAESEIIRTGINNWFENTVPSRLDNPNKGCIIIIMQRTHEDDLCGHLIEKMKNHSGDDWTVLSMPAIAENDEFIQVDDFVYKRLKGEVLHPKRFNQDGIEKIRKNMNNSTFECQYQQNPISKESQEFHSEWFKYIDRDQVPTGGRVFTTVDPAWTKQSYSDYTSILTGKFIDDKLYILGYTAGKFDPAEAIDEIVKHIKLYNPEKIGVEAIQAKGVLSVPLKNTCQSIGIYANIEEIAQKGDKESRIRKLIPLFRDGLIYFVRGIEDGQPASLEKQLLTFPRGKHDDIIDSLQMVYDLYTLQPNVQTRHRGIKVTYHNGKPVLSK